MFAIKAKIEDPDATSLVFDNQKTMYGGKFIAKNDAIFIFASENEGGCGLIARGVVAAAQPTPKIPDLARQTPRVTIRIQRTALAKRHLGRQELRPFRNWHDGKPETELNFKLYRQATDKIVGLSAEASEYLSGFFDRGDDGAT